MHATTLRSLTWLGTCFRPILPSQLPFLFSIFRFFDLSWGFTFIFASKSCLRRNLTIYMTSSHATNSTHVYKRIVASVLEQMRQIINGIPNTDHQPKLVSAPSILVFILQDPVVGLNPAFSYGSKLARIFNSGNTLSYSESLHSSPFPA